MKINYSLFLIKSSIFPVLFALLPWLQALIASVVITWCYRYVIALVLGLKVVPSMDLGCYMGVEESKTNIMSMAVFERIPAEKFKERFKVLFENCPKFRYKTVEVFGDLYYKEIPIEEALEWAFNVIPKDKEIKSDEDVDRYVQTNINLTMPLDKP